MIEIRGLPTPVVFHLYVEVEIDVCVEQRFHFFTRLSADLLKHRTFGSDDNGFLTFTLDEDGGEDADQTREFFPFFDENGDGMRHLLAGRAEDLFADQFGGEEARGLVCVVVAGEILGPLGEAADYFTAEVVESFAGGGGD